MATVLGEVSYLFSVFKAHTHHTVRMGIPSGDEGAARGWLSPGVAVAVLERAIEEIND